MVFYCLGGIAFFCLEEFYVTCAQTGSYNDPNRPRRTRLEARDPLLSMDLGTFQKRNPQWHTAGSPLTYSLNWICDFSFFRFSVALIDLLVWVMNVIPIDVPDILSIIFDRGLIGIYHDWCEPLNTYPRTYELLHSSFLFRNLKQR